ncbi:small hydrophobic protein [Harrison Dam virus]|uniref:Small hydrophobic protein n=1 Tax=Harrison Dam virus TaxID=1569259 RepID=A0A0A0V3B4_9RHAB|nr:small hydrophobic protein [Harrison Dam virus]AIW61123.1 small hydrophobic protein [Harrison Dam virus]
MIIIIFLILISLFLSKRIGALIAMYTLGYYNAFGNIINYLTFFGWYIGVNLPYKYLSQHWSELVSEYQNSKRE